MKGPGDRIKMGKTESTTTSPSKMVTEGAEYIAISGGPKQCPRGNSGPLTCSPL